MLLCGKFAAAAKIEAVFADVKNILKQKPEFFSGKSRLFAQSPASFRRPGGGQMPGEIEK